MSLSKILSLVRRNAVCSSSKACKTMPRCPEGLNHLVDKDQLKTFMTECVVKAGADRSHADQLAEVLVAADYRGHYSHGLNRLDMYIHDLEGDFCKGAGVPKICKEKPSTAWVDGDSLLGPVVGNFSMDVAIEKALQTGVGWVTAKNSNHFGIAGYYAMKAMDKGLIGLSFTNTSPLAFATRSRQVLLGTNPIAVAAPARNGDSFVLDMATTTAAIGKIELADRKNEQIPNAWAADKLGTETNDPKKVLNGGGLLPLGGIEQTGGYKGYGLSSMVELFCGILAGANWGPNVRRWKDSKRAANLGQCFVAIDPEAFAPGFGDRLQDMISTFRSSEAANPDKPVLVAGDPERNHMALCNQLRGIPYHANQYKFMQEIGNRQKVPVPSAEIL